MLLSRKAERLTDIFQGVMNAPNNQLGLDNDFLLQGCPDIPEDSSKIQDCRIDV